MGMFTQAVRTGKSVDERIKNLVGLKGAQMIGCGYCEQDYRAWGNPFMP